MLDANTTQILIHNSDVIFPYFLVTVIALLIALYLFRDRVFKKYADDYFNEEISKELNHYKKEFVSLLNNQKQANSFKKTPLLILNDDASIIHDVAYMCNYTDVVSATIDNEIDLHLYSFFLFYIPPKSSKFNPQGLFDRYFEKIFKKLNSDTSIVFIYHEGTLDRPKLSKLPKHSVVINSQLTLVERLEHAYIIKNIMQL